MTSPPPERWWLTRFVFLRALGLLFLLAFLAFEFQFKPLVGANGLMPAARYLAVVRENLPGSLARFWALPSVFWLSSSDRALAGAVTAAFQATLILGGNLAWLNYLAIILALACFDDRLLGRVLPCALTRLVPPGPDAVPRAGRRLAALALAVLVGILSVPPLLNMLSPAQAMNASFEPFHLVNTYGAFGSVQRERLTVVFQGTEDPAPAAARWTDYDYKCQPTDPARRPCWLSPYQLRLDWQAWFLPFSDAGSEPWTLALATKLLEADRATLGLFAADPFDGRRPRFVRATLYRYRFARAGESGWWVREPEGTYLPPLSLAGG